MINLDYNISLVSYIPSSGWAKAWFILLLKVSASFGCNKSRLRYISHFGNKGLFIIQSFFIIWVYR